MSSIKEIGVGFSRLTNVKDYAVHDGGQFFSPLPKRQLTYQAIDEPSSYTIQKGSTKQSNDNGGGSVVTPSDIESFK